MEFTRLDLLLLRHHVPVLTLGSNPNPVHHLDEENAQKVHQGLAKVEKVLAHSSFIIPDAPLTEADIRLYTTILRFDPVYFGHFKCNLLAVENCPNTLRWLRQISALPGVKETINMTHIKVCHSITMHAIKVLVSLLHVAQAN